MPSTSQKQHNFMAAVANNPAFAKKAGVPQSVGEEFTKADKGISFKGGPRQRPDLQKVNKPKTLQGKTELFKRGGIMKMKETEGPRTMSQDVEKGSNKKIAFGQSAVQKRGLTKGRNLGDSGPTVPIQKMKKGGESKAMVKKEVSFMKSKGAPKSMVKHEEAEMKGMKKGGKTLKYAAGGYTRAADGVASKGKTKAKQITMKSGGMSKKYC